MDDIASARDTGRHITITTLGDKTLRAFVPTPLPPNPPLRLRPLYRLMEEANQALGRLDGMSAILPAPLLFVYMYVRKEAVLSAQIEGTQSSLTDLLRFEAKNEPEAPMDDILETSLYVHALDYGLGEVRRGIPLSGRLFREVHARLMAAGRGRNKQPGEFRSAQNWIGSPGNVRYVPPPPNQVADCMAALEKFIHLENPTLPLLIRAALAHVQFESIHPFLDGNGRLGRLLITFMLCAGGALGQPTLYLSLYLKNERDQYYALLQSVHERGAWEEWVEFFLIGVRETSAAAVASVQQMLALFADDRQRIETSGHAAATALRAHDHMQRHPYITAADLAQALAVSVPTAHACIARMVDLDIIREITGRQRRRVFAYQKYLDILTEGTQPLPLR